MEPADTRREWVLWEAPAENWRAFVDELGVHPLAARILYQRGFRDPEKAGSFLEPSLAEMHDPFLMKDMKRAVREILQAIERGDRIMIHGDYDVDGVCSVSVLFEFLSELGANVDYYIPTRGEDGYGLNIASVREFNAEGCGLLITTDCGISNVEEIGLARQLGMRTVIVDHHTIPPELPPADAILNPLQEDCEFPFQELAAVGVTFNLVVGLRAALRERGVFRSIPEPDLERYLDLVALGTVADVMPLVDENRIFVRIGLDVLARRRRAGISALMDRASIEVGPVMARTISFRIAPRLNAAGRMGDASICVELLTTRDYGRATELAARLDSLNKTRQEEERGIIAEATARAEEQVAKGRKILVIHGDDWHRGVLGIVASRMTEQFHRPAIIVGVEDGLAKGSARSIEGIDLVEALSATEDLLVTYGGHAAAAGLSLERDVLDEFARRIDDAIGASLQNRSLPRPTLNIDSLVSLKEISHSFLDDLRRLGPFGSGNPEPVLLCRSTKATNVKVVAKRHVRAKFRDDTGAIQGFGFAMGRSADIMSEPVAVAFVPRRSVRRGKRRLEIQLRGIRPAAGDVPDTVRSSEDDD